MRFSILIPVYNVEKYLDRCMETVMAQTFTDFEVILADDGSTDRSGAMCDGYAAKYPDRVRVFHKENEGLLMTRRYSLKRARGEYMIFVDSDDYVAENLLETVNDAIDKYGADMVLYNFYRFVEGEEGMNSPEIPFADGTVFEGEGKRELYEQFIGSRILVNMWLKAVKRSFVDVDADYTDRNVSKCEDVVQSLPLFDSCERIVYIDNPLYYYRKNSGSMTLNVRVSDLGDYLIMSEQVLIYADAWGMSDEIKKTYIAWLVGHLYNYLRLFAKKDKTASQRGIYNESVNYLWESAFFEKALLSYDPAYSPKRLRFRLKFFVRSMVKHRAASLRTLIRLSNLIGG